VAVTESRSGRWPFDKVLHVLIAPAGDDLWWYQEALYDPVEKLSSEQLLARLKVLKFPWEREAKLPPLPEGIAKLKITL
jgi:hypothetical protein